jgi:sortase (surface protein transpeptidase)
MGPRLLAWLLAALLLAGCAGAAEPHIGIEKVKLGTGTPRSTPSTNTPTTTEPTPKRPDVHRVAQPMMVRIPAIDVNADLVGVGLNPDGSMETPAYDSNQAGWYTKGPMPGEAGPAVIAAHVDSKTGPDVFYRLRDLRRGDHIVVIDRAGSRYLFTVNRLERHDKQALPYAKIWNETSAPVLRLVTCAGSYDRSAGEYEENLIVYAS